MEYRTPSTGILGHVFSMVASLLLTTRDPQEQAFWQGNVELLAEACFQVASLETYKRLRFIYREGVVKAQRLREENGDLITENEELRKKLAREESRRKHAEANLARATDFWRAAEEELTEKMEEIEELKRIQGDAFTSANNNNISS
ncbi:hypothetical protein F53441_6294 [Fusarium austroafricanum]|uniref:Uncharacterized protein n=1 Tax=Fusarium austroafricanum TaxID=2364996 RepID=A0A8H4NYT8_9HYPO|nr:hypothetical protein F53441_6294 [Fusarium austroafricanum]